MLEAECYNFFSLTNYLSDNFCGNGPKVNNSCVIVTLEPLLFSSGQSLNCLQNSVMTAGYAIIRGEGLAQDLIEGEIKKHFHLNLSNLNQTNKSSQYQNNI